MSFNVLYSGQLFGEEKTKTVLLSSFSDKAKIGFAVSVCLTDTSYFRMEQDEEPTIEQIEAKLVKLAGYLDA